MDTTPRTAGGACGSGVGARHSATVATSASKIANFKVPELNKYRPPLSAPAVSGKSRLLRFSIRSLIMYGLASKSSGDLNDHYNEAIVKRLPRETGLVYYL